MTDPPEYQRMAKLSASETLTATILNELTQPLSSAVMHIAALTRMAESSHAPVDRASLSHGLERLDHAVRRCTLVISRMRALVLDGRPVHTVVGLDTIFQSALRAIENAPGRYGVQIEIETSRASEPVLCDPVHIEQVVVNLLLNAIDATRTQPLPKIELRAESRRTLAWGRFIEVTVTDNGHGVGPGREEALFRPFRYTGHGTAGLGLAICRSLVEMHGGKIWHAPSRSGGASFHFTIPHAPKKGWTFAARAQTRSPAEERLA